MHLLLLKTLENADKHVTYHLDDLVIVELEGHLEVKANKFSEMSMCVWVLRAEYSTNCKNLEPK